MSEALKRVHLSNGESYDPVLVVSNDGYGRWHLFLGKPGASTGVRDDPNRDFITRKGAVAAGVLKYGVKAITEEKWLRGGRNVKPRGTNPHGRRLPGAVKKARRRVAIKRQLRRAGVSVSNEASTRDLRQARREIGRFQISAYSTSQKKLVWWDGHGWTLRRENAALYGSKDGALATARNTGIPTAVVNPNVSVQQIIGTMGYRPKR